MFSHKSSSDCFSVFSRLAFLKRTCPARANAVVAWAEKLLDGNDLDLWELTVVCLKRHRSGIGRGWRRSTGVKGGRLARSIGPQPGRAAQEGPTGSGIRHGESGQPWNRFDPTSHAAGRSREGRLVRTIQLLAEPSGGGLRCVPSFSALKTMTSPSRHRALDISLICGRPNSAQQQTRSLTAGRSSLKP